MKRSPAKSKTPRRADGEEGSRSFFGKKRAPAAAPEKTWEEWVKDQPDEAFVPHSLQGRFEKGMLLSHTKFGKGAVLSAGTTSVEVLFEEGTKKLAHAQ